MFKIKSKILKKLSAGFMAGLCAFSMLGSTMSGVITANAASTSTENSAFPSADTVIAKAATLLGSPYTFGNKGYWYAYNQGQYTPLSVQTINNLGIDCSGLVYYTLTQLGYKTSGFSWNNPVPVDTDHWLTVNDNCTISYGGKTSKVDVEKKNIKTTDRPYWECSNGSTITPGSVVVAQNPYGEDHAWIYMGEFNSRSDVVSYLKSIGVSESLINSKTVGDGKGDGGKHWRIEANGSEGVVINNKTDGKTATAMNMSAFRITKTDVTFEIDKYNTNGDLVGKSSVDNSTAVYGIYHDKSCKNKVAEIKIGSNGKGSVKLPSKTYYAKELKAPTGYSVDPTVYTIKAGKNKVKEDYETGTIKINKTAEDGIISGREFNISYTYNGKSLTETAKTNAKGIATLDDLKVYDMSTGKAITYTVSEINVDTRYETPKAKNVKLTDGDVDLTVNVKFNNELKTGSIKINKQSEDNQNGGREFTVTGNGKTYSIKTGSDGVAILSDIPVYDSNNQKIVYTISEKNVPVKYAQSFEWFLKSAHEGNKFAQYSLANLYYYGNGVEKDLSQAFWWYRKSSEQGQPYASYAVAQMYSKGEYVAENKETAQRYYKAALSGFLELESKDQADDNLYYKLGAMYKNGLGTEIDIPKAIEYFEKSTENMWSTYQLGRLYLFGAEELEKDKEKAVEWLTKSANDGNEYAQNMLDNMAQFENTILANTIFALFANLCKCIEDDYTHKYKSVRHTVDSRLRRMIRQKKQSFGIKDEQSQSYEQS